MFKCKKIFRKFLTFSFLTMIFLGGLLIGQAISAKASVNIALHKSATASSYSGGNKASAAVDGSTGTRWESTQGVDGQWLEIDLGASYVVTGSKLTWEAAAAKDYKIQVSNDEVQWDDLYVENGGKGGEETITFTAPKTGRYVRMYGITRTTTYGYSLWEFEVYGTPVTNYLVPPLITPVTGSYSTSQTVNIVDGDPDAQIRYTTDGSIPTPTSGILYSSSLTIPATTTINAIAYTAVNNYSSITTANISVEVPLVNIALNKSASASTTNGTNLPKNAFDGNTGTRWESAQGVDNQWISVDLGASYTVIGAKLNWETAAAKDYKIQVSTDGTSWDDAYSEVGGSGGIEKINFATPKSGRYVRMYGTARTTGYGYSLWEFEVYGVPILNRTALTTAVNDANLLFNSKVVGAIDGDVPQSAADTFKNAINSATSVLSSIAVTQGDIDAQVNALTAASTAFNNSVININRSLLSSAINTANSLLISKIIGAADGNVPQSAVDTFKNSIDWATLVLNGSAVTQADVDGQVTALATATSTFNNSIVIVHKSQLSSSIDNANALLLSKIIGAADGNVPQSAVDTFKLAIDWAKVVLNNPASTQADVDGQVTTLVNATSVFNNSTVVVNRSALSSAISNANSVLLSKVIGAADGNVPQSAVDTYKLAIDGATLVLNNIASTQADVDGQVNALSIAANNFNNSIIKVNKNLLKSAIDDALALVSSKAVGAADGNVPQSALDAYKSAIDAGKAVLNSTSSTQMDVDGQVNALANATDNFNNSIIKVNKNSLKAAIDDALALLNSKVVGAAEGNVPQSAADTFNSVVNAAKLIFNSTSATQADVDGQLNVITLAEGNFKGSIVHVNKNSLQTAIDSANAVLSSKTIGAADGNVPQSSADAFKNAINLAVYIYNSPSSTQADIDGQVAALIAATSIFNNSVVVVNKSALSLAISNANTLLLSKVIGDLDGNVPQSAVDSYKLVIDWATLVLNNTDSTQADIDAQVNALLLATQNFNNSVLHVNKNALKTAIDNANTLLNSKVIGAADGNVSQSSVDSFKNVINAATSVYNSSSATQLEVDEKINALAAALDNFNNSIVKVNRNALKTAIDNANTLLISKVVGKADGNVPQSAVDVLRNAINSAKTVLNSTSSTQINVDGQVNALAQDISAFNNSVVKVDKNLLKTALDNANALLNSKIVGTAEGNVPQSAVDIFKVAINSAKTVLNNGNSSQADIDGQVNALLQATKKFNNSIVKINRNSLKAAIDKANALLKSKNVGMSDGDVTENAVDDLSNAINIASKIYGNSSATQAEVDEQVSALAKATEAFNNCIVKVNKTLLKSALDDAVTLLSSKVVGKADGNIPQSAADDFKDAMDNAEKVLNNPSSTQSEVDAQLKSLKNATDKLSTSVVKIDKNSLKTAISDAETLIKSKVAGEADGDVPQSAIDELNKTISKTITVLNDPYATQDVINQQIKILDEAVVKLNNSVVKVDKNELKSELDSAKALIGSKIVGTSQGNVPKDAVDTLNIVISKTLAVLNSSNSTQKQIDDELKALEEATEIFNKAVIKIEKPANESDKNQDDDNNPTHGAKEINKSQNFTNKLAGNKEENIKTSNLKVNKTDDNKANIKDKSDSGKNTDDKPQKIVNSTKSYSIETIVMAIISASIAAFCLYKFGVKDKKLTK